MYSIDENGIIAWSIVIGILYPIGMSWYLWREWQKLKGNESRGYTGKTYRGAGAITDPFP
jgi:hypothetical protein